MAFEYQSGPELPPLRRGQTSGKRLPERLVAPRSVNAAQQDVTLPPYKTRSLKLRVDERIETEAPVPLAPQPYPDELSPAVEPARRRSRPARRLAQTQERHALGLRRKAKRAQMWQKRLRSLMRITLVLATLIFIPVFLQATFWRWTPEDTALSWDGYTKPTVVTRLLKRYAKQPLWAVNPLEVAERLEQALPVVADVQVRRHLMPAHVEITAVEHQPWGLLYEPVNAAGMSSARPYALVAESHQPIGIRPSGYRWQALTKAHPQVPLLADSGLFKIWPLTEQRLFFQRLDTVIQHYQQIPRLHLRAVSIKPDKTAAIHFDEMDVLVGPLESDNLNKAGRLSPLIRTLSDEQLGKLDRVDLRWEKNVYWHERKDSEA